MREIDPLTPQQEHSLKLAHSNVVAGIAYLMHNRTEALGLQCLREAEDRLRRLLGMPKPDRGIGS